MSWPQTGIHEGVPFDIYRADDITQSDNSQTVIGKAVSKSLIVDFIKDPAAWKASKRKKSTGAMKAGSLLDCLLTTPDEIKSRYVLSEYDKFNSNESKAWRAKTEASGAEVIKQDQLDAAQAQVAAIYAHPAARQLLDGARMQVAFRHKTAHGFDSKGLIDVVPSDTKTLADIKTCDPRALESHRALQRHIFEWSYHVQAGGYCDGYAIATDQLKVLFKFKFIFVASKPPYRVAVIELNRDACFLGADTYRNGMAQLAKCLKADTWPSIWDSEVELDLPTYAYPDLGGDEIED